MYVAWYVNKQLLDVCSIICKQTMDVYVNNYWMYVAWYVNKQWMYVAWYVNKQLLDVCSMICKQTITGCM